MGGFWLHWAVPTWGLSYGCLHMLAGVFRRLNLAGHQDGSLSWLMVDLGCRLRAHLWLSVRVLAHGFSTWRGASHSMGAGFLGRISQKQTAQEAQSWKLQTSCDWREWIPGDMNMRALVHWREGGRGRGRDIFPETGYHNLKSLWALTFHSDIVVSCSLCLVMYQIPSSLFSFHPPNNLLNSHFKDGETKAQTG